MANERLIYILAAGHQAVVNRPKLSTVKHPYNNTLGSQRYSNITQLY